MAHRIVHVDMDAFFASVEQVHNPSLRGKALIIGGERTDRRGVVSTASYEARQYGIHSGMPLVEAVRLCPKGIFMRGNFERYREASEKIRRILESVSPLVEMASIDEAYLDITGSLRLFGGEDAAATHIKERILAETGLPCTLAISSNKLVSKIGSALAKPDGCLRIALGDESAFLRPLPVARLVGVGPRTRQTLEDMGLHTIGMLADFPLEKLVRVFGQATGYSLHRAARGIGSTTIVSGGLPQSISRETTFKRDTRDWIYISALLTYLAERAAFALREHGLATRRITLKVRYADFHTRTLSQTLPEPTTLDGVILSVLLNTLLPRVRERQGRLRLVGVCLGSLTASRQRNFFDRKQEEKWERVLAHVDQARHRHGFSIIRTARSFGAGRTVSLATPSLSR